LSLTFLASVLELLSPVLVGAVLDLVGLFLVPVFVGLVTVLPCWSSPCSCPTFLDQSLSSSLLVRLLSYLVSPFLVLVDLVSVLVGPVLV